eukprot:CAMPEP_0119107804 /NCGR_PEP_ID=MMETSP1180-20130426/11608_1 /TAXON_ID=3052 ORGANISM="Chlamydomonas cf sp, Strain CCMP681" /NCGR_SAMPLE_ID=MMETSP1180 /ASSEMBLY_ACC=CAM_ASM_000741 /LENGTH=437 /DNA_ID=CAMNT_0007093347 /DNA_START=11 /DNA_END=1324 /DNA_ORIENTATION=+
MAVPWSSVLGLALLLALAGEACASIAGTRVLVLLQDASQESGYSQFLNGLTKAGFQLTIKGHKDSGLKLKEYDTWHYDHLAILAPKAESFGGSIDLAVILQFVDSGHNLLLAGGPSVSDNIRAIAAEVGVDMDERGTSVFDHFAFAHKTDGQPDHTLIVAKDIVSAPAIFSSAIKAPILFRGVGCAVSANSELITVALSAPWTSYSTDPRKPMLEPTELMVGSNIALVAAVQARNNARVLVTGSVDLFSDELAAAEVLSGPSKTTAGKSGNAEFVSALALWTLQDRGVLRAEGLRHRLLSAPEGSSSPYGYRVSDDVEFAVDIFEFKAGQKQPYKADDVQVEFVMLDPHVRLPLEHDGKGTFSVRFKVPDVYGVFKYVVNYKHQGYSYIELTQQVPVRPFKHDEYERFLGCAFPYYASALSTMLAFFSLGFFYLYHK